MFKKTCEWEKEIPVVSNLTSNTLKTVKYEEIEFKNPWDTFKEGLLPIGLAEAYEVKHGYNPLKECRLNIWLSHLRGITFHWSIAAMVLVALSIPAYEGSLLKSLLQIIGIPYVIGITICLIVLVFLTRKAHKRSRNRMWHFKKHIQTFVMQFRSILEDGRSSITASMGLDELFAKVTEDMTEVAQSIIEGEVAGQKVGNEQNKLKQKSFAANEFGLGQEWSIYFVKARARMNPYDHFAWEI